MKIVVGLGNIGDEFERTNHNMGFMVVDRVAQALNVNIKKQMCSCFVGEVNNNGEKILLAKPTTYMNNSGIAVKSLVKKFGIDSSKDLVIISDDIDLPQGKIRVRERGSAGTHNGLRSIVKQLESEDFARIRIGIGKPGLGQNLADFVVSSVNIAKELEDGLEKGKEACLMFCDGKRFAEIMQKFN